VLSPLTDDLKRQELNLKFRLAAERYEIIRENRHRSWLPYDDEARRIRDMLMRDEKIDYATLDSAQRYFVGVQDHC